MENKKNSNNSSNSLVFGRLPQTKRFEPELDILEVFVVHLELDEVPLGHRQLGGDVEDVRVELRDRVLVPPDDRLQRRVLRLLLGRN